MERKPVESSTLQSVGYDEAAKILQVQFVNGGIFNYQDVPQAIYDGLMKARSHGKFFHTQIRSKFKTSKLP